MGFHNIHFTSRAQGAKSTYYGFYAHIIVATFEPDVLVFIVFVFTYLMWSVQKKKMKKLAVLIL